MALAHAWAEEWAGAGAGHQLLTCMAGEVGVPDHPNSMPEAMQSGSGLLSWSGCVDAVQAWRLGRMQCQRLWRHTELGDGLSP